MATAAAVAPQGAGDNTNRGGIQFLSIREKLLLTFTGCRNHNWSFPQTSEEMKKAYAANAPYDSHQQCPKCGSMRLYNQKTMEGGPIFHLEMKQYG